MGLMNATAPLIVTPHPVTLEGQRTLAAELREGERLGAFLARNVPDYGGDLWEVRINGVLVPHEVMDRVRPKGGAVIEVRGVVKKTALMIVALVALTVFTAGVGTAMVTAGYGAVAVGMAQAAIYAAGALIINKVLGPKQPKPRASDAGTVYSIGASRNQPRPYEPLGLLLGGPMRITPDVASNPYSWYEGDDQYMAMVLTPGINVGRVEALYNGDALLSTFEGVTVWHNGFSQMPSEDIPLYSNADTIAGGALEAEKGRPSQWVQRTSSANTIRLKVDVDFMLFDTTSKGKPKDNQETIEVQYRVVGATNWMFYGSYAVVSRSQKQQRRSYSLDVHEGQYEVRVRIAGRNTDGSGATSDFTWSTLTSIQKDTADYAGLSRIGIRIKATGQLNGQPDEIRCVAYSAPVPVWTEAGWVTQETSNPGALILAYARGFRDESGKLIAGVGLEDPQIDIEALKGFMLSCAAEGYTYAHHIKDVRNHDDVLNAVALAGFGQISWAGGRLSVVWAGADQPLSGVVNMATIKKGQFQVDYTLANAADGIEYSYFDATDWTTKTLRVAAPGVTTMLNPATVQGEGITSEAHAARMARYHLAQSLYQYKDISYSTDIEHLSYRRLSVLALQHDLTQWGFGGRLVSTSLQAGIVTLQLDEPVPAPAAGNAYIGLRIPGERVYRVFRVQPFTGTSDTLRLIEAWPADAPLPGAAAANPAHDTIWIYDFKQTPGYRVRVTGIEPESDLKGAKVSVVPEPPEFWNYVLTGQYVPPVNNSPSLTRPVASGLAVTEQQVVQGDTVFTELTVTFEVSGPVGNVVVLAAGSDGVLAEVAQTSTRTATWRISQADQYTVVVRPFSPEGQVGVSASVTYVTAGADVPPQLVDYFEVNDLAGGVRMYTWGFLADTIQSPDFAGVEVRYTAGVVAEPVWEAMTPIGETGYHTVPFEAVVPKAGNWTFACRSRNTSGELSTDMRVVTKALGQNLGEQLQETYEEAERANQRVGQEIIDRLAGDLAAVNEAIGAANDALSKAREYTDAQVAALNGILEDIVGADEWAAGITYPEGDFVQRNGTLYRALRENTGVEPGTAPATWQEIGDYTSVGEALAASISMSTQNATDISAQASRVDAVSARMPAGGGQLATSAQVASMEQASVDRDEAISDRTLTLEARMPAGSGLVASQAQVDVAQQARAEGDAALARDLLAVRAESENAFSPVIGWEFVGNSAGFTAAGAVLDFFPIAASIRGAMAVFSNSNDPQILSPEINVPGKACPIVRARIRRRQGGPIWDGTLYWATDAHSFSGQYVGYPDVLPVPDGFVTVTWDLSGSEDWNSSVIKRLRLDLGAAPNDLFDIQWLMLGSRGGGTAQTLNLVQSSVQGQGENLEALARDVASATAALSGKAESSAVRDMASTVQQQGAQISAFSNSVDQVKAQLGGSGNLVKNAGFESSLSGWNKLLDQWGADFQRNLAGEEWRPSGISTIGASVAGTPSGSLVVGSDLIPVEAGKRYIGSVYSAAHRCQTFGRLVFLDAAGREIGNGQELVRNPGAGGGNQLNFWHRGVSPAVVAPAAAVGASFQLWILATGGTDPYGWFARPMLEEARADQSSPSPWQLGAAGVDAKYAAATQALSVRATQLENGQSQLQAQYSWALDVNGRAIGMTSINNGTIGRIDFVADRFGIVDPNNTGSTTFEGGRWITRSGGYMLAHGKPFGVTGDLMMWLGIGSDPANASKGNGLF